MLLGNGHKISLKLWAVSGSGDKNKTMLNKSPSFNA
jgi:hypothetical protein